MRVRDYFVGQANKLQSPLAPAVVAQRINAASGSIFWPFNHGVVGWANFGLVRLAFRSSFFEFNGKPILAGRVADHLGGSILELRYRAPLSAYFFFFLWYSLLSLMISITVIQGGDMQFLVPLGVFAFLPIIILKIGTHNAYSEIHEIIGFLTEHAQASPAPN